MGLMTGQQAASPVTRGARPSSGPTLVPPRLVLPEVDAARPSELMAILFEHLPELLGALIAVLGLLGRASGVGIADRRRGAQLAAARAHLAAGHVDGDVHPRAAGRAGCARGPARVPRDGAVCVDDRYRAASSLRAASRAAGPRRCVPRRVRRPGRGDIAGRPRRSSDRPHEVRGVAAPPDPGRCSAVLWDRLRRARAARSGPYTIAVLLSGVLACVATVLSTLGGEPAAFAAQVFATGPATLQRRGRRAGQRELHGSAGGDHRHRAVSRSRSIATGWPGSCTSSARCARSARSS